MLISELGGEVWLGNIGNGKEIKAKIYFGFNPRDPRGNYLYAKINTLTIQGLLGAFDKDISLPEKVKQSGFPEGLVIGFTANPDGKYIFLIFRFLVNLRLPVSLK